MGKTLRQRSEARMGMLGGPGEDFKNVQLISSQQAIKNKEMRILERIAKASEATKDNLEEVPQ